MKKTAAAAKTKATKKTPATAAPTQEAAAVAAQPKKATKGVTKAPKPTAKKASTKKGATTKEAGTSKKAIVIALVGRKSGATLTEIMEALGWQAHSVRGLVSTLNKAGTKIASSKSEAGARNYKAA